MASAGKPKQTKKNQATTQDVSSERLVQNVIRNTKTEKKKLNKITNPKPSFARNAKWEIIKFATNIMFQSQLHHFSPPISKRRTQLLPL